MHHQPYRIVVVAGLLTAFCGLSGMRLVDADTVEISGGGHLTGDVSRQADSVVIRVDDEIHIALPASRVRRGLTLMLLPIAQAARQTMMPNCITSWRSMCPASNVPGNATTIATTIFSAISLDPDHRSSRRSGLQRKMDNGSRHPT